MDLIPDKPARELAETTFDRNVVVVAGAGTGKTTLLVNRLVHLLIKEPQPVAVTQLVALTFTNKAATEMKVRLRERLSVLARPVGEGVRAGDGGAVSLDELRHRYGLSSDEIAARAAAALRDIEKAQIGTLHSFAAHLLRLFPLESGVDPSFQEDDGSRFDEYFSATWDAWGDRELSRQGMHHRAWRELLAASSLDDVRELARALCSDLVDLAVVRRQLEENRLDPLLTEWLREQIAGSEALLAAHDRPKRRGIEQMLAAAIAVMRRVGDAGADGLSDVAGDDRECLAKTLNKKVAGWEKAEVAAAASAIKVAQQLLTVDHRFFETALQLFTPLVEEIRAGFLRKGWLSFDGLLARARTLLRDHPMVRERIKREFRSVLVDEFQDTDPIQYEIVLAISARVGAQGTSWQDVQLEPGKLFIVGDPKQSIYAFRRADIEAFDRVVRKIEAGGGLVETLTTNFRSDGAVLEPVNDIFDRLFERRPMIQPGNVRLRVKPQRRPSLLEAGVRCHVTTPPHPDESFDAAGATRAESEALARWLAEDVLPHPNVRAGQVALLFRKLTQADTYLDALRRYGIPYVIEGEKHFYRRQEVIDVVNLLRVLDHPHDEVALAGVLRSPLGGLPDRALYELRQAGGFDYLRPAALLRWSHPAAAAVSRLYGHLAWLHHRIGSLPLADALQTVFDRLPILELAAASLHGEQAVANLLKVRQTAAGVSDRPHMTLSGFVELMVERLDEQPDEAESPLAEESSDAVQVLTIHKAKGLEFPVVVLPGLHQGSGRERAAPVISFDWSSGTYGLALADHRTVGAVLLHEKRKVREDAERRRVLYVGMTRAKDLLILSGGTTGRSMGESVWSLLQAVGTGTVGVPETDALTIGASAIPHRIMQATHRKRAEKPVVQGAMTAGIDEAAITSVWQARHARWETVRGRPARVTPTGLTREGPTARPLRATAAGDGEFGRLVGTAVHRILEQWDFTRPAEDMRELIDPVVSATVSAEQDDLHQTLVESVGTMLKTFGQSDAYATLAQATILGREVPFFMPWKDGQVLEGVIDVIYRVDNRIWVADYKTDAVTAEEAPVRAERYRTQAGLYATAAAQCLKVPSVSARLLFLRPAVAVDL